GDVVELDTGHEVRYAGIIAPKPGDAFYEEARLRNDQFVRGTDVKVDIKLVPGKTDRKGRPCAIVLVPAKSLKASVMVNTEILESGLARIDYSTLPAGREEFFETREERARRAKLGIWSLRR
ncbi:MAG: thermonuclease family protein, partial [Planctomycetota bacterium]